MSDNNCQSDADEEELIGQTIYEKGEKQQN